MYIKFFKDINKKKVCSYKLLTASKTQQKPFRKLILFNFLLLLFIPIFQSCNSEKKVIFLIGNTNQRKTEIPLRIIIDNKVIYNDSVVNRFISPDYDEVVYSTVDDSISIIFESNYFKDKQIKTLQINSNEKYVFVTFSEEYRNTKINIKTGIIYPSDTIDKFEFYPADNKPVLM